MDRQWWDIHIEGVRSVFKGELLSSSNTVKRHGVPAVGRMGVGWEPFGNSGAACISLAAAFGASKIILLGYDCQKTGGMAHWHGNHPRGLGNAGALPRWPAQFKRLRDKYPDANIVNCSRETALECFPRSTLEKEL